MTAQNRQRRDRQLTVQFTNEEVHELEQIAQIEERDRAYLVAWFTRWGISHYWNAGSLVALRNTRPIPVESGLELPRKDRERFFSTTSTRGEEDDGRKETLSVPKKPPAKTGTR